MCDIAFPIWFSCLWASPGRYAHAPLQGCKRVFGDMTQ